MIVRAKQSTASQIKNLFAEIPANGCSENEDIREILARPGLKIERIVSHGQASAPDFWYDQPWNEWVIVLSGSAGLRFEDESGVRVLSSGDYLCIPAGTRHRVDWTSKTEATVWLAVHFASEEPLEACS
jgi:cupin 2 domain-containing protein